jgi:hypothetical protein
MLSSEFQGFYDDLLEKALRYNDDNLKECFDKFFTLFVVYNRLYAETTFVLARKGAINLRNRTSFPDSQAAKHYVHQYLGTNRIWAALQDDISSRQAIDNIVNIIDNRVFAIKLDLISGESKREEDAKLLESLKSTSHDLKVEAILDIIYSIRCNMFHGHKGFHQVQTQILFPVNRILERVVILLHGQLANDY